MEKHSMKRIVVTVAVLASLLAGGALLAGSDGLAPTSPNVLAPASSQASAGAVGAASAQEAIRTVKLKVDGLWCASCAYIARQALMKTPGVLEAKVSGRARTAVVTYDPTKADPQALIAATTDYGYPSQVLVQ